MKPANRWGLGRSGKGRLLLVFGLLMAMAQSALAVCSSYLGKVVFNEIQIPANNATYLELRVLDPNIPAATNNFANWYVDVYKADGGTTTVLATQSTNLKTVFTDPTLNTCGQNSSWIQIPNTSLSSFITQANDAKPRDDLNFVLYETSSGTKRIVDVLRLGPSTSYYGVGTNYESCSTIEAAYGTKYTQAWSNSGTKDWYRSPDGTGTWGNAVSSNNSNSICGNNNASSAEIGLNKTASTAAVGTNTNFTYTLFAQNPSTGTAKSNVSVVDTLPSGVTYVSCAATSPDTCTYSSAANTVTWLISSLPTNTSRTATITAYATTTGSKVNTIASTAAGTLTATATINVSSSAPIVTTVAADPVASTSATLKGTVNPNNFATTVSFSYGTTPGAYPNSCTPATASFSGTTVQSFSCGISGLSCGTTYYYIASGSNSAGSVNGAPLSFTTPSCGASFDAYETGFTAANAIAGTAKLKTHIASDTGICVKGGTACSLTIGVFNTGKTALQTSFAGPVKVEIVDSSSGSCSTYGLIATVSASLALDSDGETNVALPAVANAYPNARIRISYPASGTATSQSCSADNFAIRPNSFVGVSATDGSATTPGSTNALANTTLTRPPTTAAWAHKAGQYFTLNARAANASGTTTTSYAGTATSVLSACTGAACTATQGTLTIGGSFASGVLASNLASYNDIGSFNLTLQDTGYADVDLADSTADERTISSTATAIGRFIPDHFDVAFTAKGCSTFTYSGQPFSLKVTAKDAAGNTLTRYNGAAGGLATTVALSDANGISGSFDSASLLSTDFVSGVAGDAALSAAVSRTFTFTSRTTTPSAIRLRATDLDLVSSSTGTEDTNTVVSGRLAMLNAYGSDQLPLPLTLQVQYYSTAAPAAGWRQSSGSYADTCTNLSASNFAFTTAAPACATAVSTCNSALSMTATGAGPYKAPWTTTLGKPVTTGSACVAINLDGSAAGKQCTSTGTPGAAPTSVGAPWLKYPWAGATATNPTAQVTFGIYKSPLFFMRENY